MLKKIVIIFIMFFAKLTFADYNISFMMTNDQETIGYVKLKDDKSQNYLKIECNNIFNNFNLYLYDEEITKSRKHTFEVKTSFNKKEFENSKWKKVYINNEYVLMKNYNNKKFINDLGNNTSLLLDIPDIKKVFFMTYNDSLLLKQYIHKISQHCNINY